MGAGCRENQQKKGEIPKSRKANGNQSEEGQEGIKKGRVKLINYNRGEEGEPRTRTRSNVGEEGSGNQKRKLLGKPRRERKLLRLTSSANG